MGKVIPSSRNVLMPMDKTEAYLLSVFAHMEICCNILERTAKPGSRRHNRIKTVQAQFPAIDETFGNNYLPEHWIQKSQAFELKMQNDLNELLDSFKEDKPLVEPQAPQIPKGKSQAVKIKEVISMQDQLGKINELMDTFKTEAAKSAAGNKAAGVRARKASLALAKELKTFRSLSVAQ